MLSLLCVAQLLGLSQRLSHRIAVTELHCPPALHAHHSAHGSSPLHTTISTITVYHSTLCLSLTLLCTVLPLLASIMSSYGPSAAAVFVAALVLLLCHVEPAHANYLDIALFNDPPCASPVNSSLSPWESFTALPQPGSSNCSPAPAALAAQGVLAYGSSCLQTVETLTSVNGSTSYRRLHRCASTRAPPAR